MKVFFTCSTSKFNEYQDLYLTINQEIKNQGHNLVSDWITEFGKGSAQKNKEEENKAYEKIISLISESDVVIVEGTVGSLSIGHIITLATQRDKPVLLLSYLPEKHEKFFINEFTESNKPSLVMKVEYEKANLSHILDNFFSLYKDGGKFRFNLLLDSDVREYLNWASDNYDKTKSAIIRDLVRAEAKQDKKYVQSKKQSNPSLDKEYPSNPISSINTAPELISS